MARRHANTGLFTVLDEDFQPKWEEREEEWAHLLFVYLPDFSKDQIRVTYEHPMRSVRVEGERSLGNNKWSRFNRAFSVSQNCIAEGIYAVFQGGKLTITILKQTGSPPQPAASFLNGEGQWFVEKSDMNISPRDSKQSVQSDDRKTKGEEIDASTSSKAPYVPILQKQDETPPVKETEKTIEKQKGDEVKKEISFIEKAKEMTNVAAAAIKTSLENEDRQLIVNMGVAALTIMAFGAYVTHST
ncbi:hypothetical protein SLEP1_g47442 [Rubroshorea leprosula]|uniref:SHSP domain-containing protein n=1 Tax=Rubroshorea leprosula TaxID=152421 RepID=A0AAV5LS86_9ROSI|nr:hypothetical protein SLEP1_g47442 [Rubroshorea leprosula]